MGARLVAIGVLAAFVAAQDGPRVLVRGCVTLAADGTPVAGAQVIVRSWFDVVGVRRVAREPREPLHRLVTDAAGDYAIPAGDGDHGPVITVCAPGFASVTWRADVSRPDGPAPRRDVALAAAGAFQGTVFDAEGAPVPGARVFAVERDALEIEDHPDSGAAAADLLWGSGQYDEDIAYRCVETVADPQGRYVLGDARSGTRYVLVAGAAGTGPAFHPHAVTPGATVPRRVDLYLPRPVRVAVRVRTPGGEELRVPKAHLVASPVATSWDEADEGAHILAPVGPGNHVLVLETETRGEIRHAFRVPGGVDTHAIEIRVDAGLAVAGVVRDGSGAPVEGARVNVQVWNPATGHSGSTDVRTDADGRFASWGHPKGRTLVYVLKDGYQTAALELDGPDGALTVRLLRARDVRIRVDPPPGLPRGQWLHYAARVARGPWVDDQVSWERGRGVLLEGIPVGRTTLRLWAPGCALLEREIEVPDGEGALALDALRLSPARTVIVRVVDEGGNPLPGLKVHATVDDLPPVNWTEIQKTTGSDGRAVLEVHAPGPPLTVYIEQGGGRQRVYRSVAMPADPRTVVDVPAGVRVR